MSSYTNSLFIPIESHSNRNSNSVECSVSPKSGFTRKSESESSPQSVTDVSRITPSITPSIVSSSVFPRSASEALFDSSSKFRQLPCRTFISVGTCPYRERCVYLHDPRCICREAKTKTRRKNKEDVVVDALFWPVMPYSLVAGKLDSSRQPHVIQSYSVPIPQQDHYRSHDQAVYSCWMHFVDFCLANSESQCGTDAAPCFQAPDQRINAYTDKERLAVFRCLSSTGRNGHPDMSSFSNVPVSNAQHQEGRGGNVCADRGHSPAAVGHTQTASNSYSKPQHFTAPNDIRNLQYPVLNQPVSNGGGSGYGQVSGPHHNSLLNLYAESNPHAHNGRNSAMHPTVQQVSVVTAVSPNRHFFPEQQQQMHYQHAQQRHSPEQFRGGAQREHMSYACQSPDAASRQDRPYYSSPSPISIAEKGSPAAASTYVKIPFPTLAGVGVTAHYRHFNESGRGNNIHSHSVLSERHYSLDECEEYDYFPGYEQQETELYGAEVYGSHLYTEATTQQQQHRPRLSADAPEFRFGGYRDGAAASMQQVFA